MGVDAFNYNWSSHINWLFPPPRLLEKTLNHLKSCKAVGVILTPEWKGSSFYAYFRSDIFKRHSKNVEILWEKFV